MLSRGAESRYGLVRRLTSPRPGVAKRRRDLARVFIMLPTKFGEKYLSFHFDRKLADLKDAQNQKIESLKEQLNHLGDRGKRSNEREYEALSDIWGQFVDAFDSTERCVTQFIE